MIINNSSLALSAQHQKSTVSHQEESLELYRQQGDTLVAEQAKRSRTEVSLSQQGVQLAQQLSPATVATPATSAPPHTHTAATSATGSDDEAALPPRLKLAKSIIEALTGKEIRLDVRQSQDGADKASAGAGADGAEGRLSRGQLVGVRYHASESYHESEQLNFSARGSVTTRDGREIQLDLAFSMSRSFSQSESVTFQAGVQLKDPLVINYDGGVAELTASTFAFDIDSDGRQDQISFVTEGSGMLMLDRNGDGKASNGSELFGAQSGNGFRELAAFDEDGNGFIDEGDSVYHQLQIWVRSGGEDQYYTLAEKDVGAIYLGAVATPFELKNSDNELLGVVRSGSIFIGESGRAGSVQQVDLAV